MEEELDNKDLEPSHGENKPALQQAEGENAPLCALNRAEVSVLARPEVFLVTRDGRQLCRQLEDGFFEDGGLLGGGTLLGGDLCAGSFVFNLRG